MPAGREVVQTDKAPAALGPYSQGIKAGGTVYVSGQLGLVPGEKALQAGIEGQTHQTMKNLSAVLEEAGASLDSVIKTTVLLSDMSDFQAMNGVYSQYFKQQPPARMCYAVKALPLQALVEIEAIAALSKL